MSGRSDDYRELNRSMWTQAPQAESKLLIIRCHHRVRVTKIEIHAQDPNWFEVGVRDFATEELAEDEEETIRRVRYLAEEEKEDPEILRFLRLNADGYISIDAPFHDPELMVEAGQEIIIENHEDGSKKCAVNVQIFEQNPFLGERRVHPIKIDDQDSSSSGDSSTSLL